MSRSSSPLNNIKVASPCSADWDQMYGDDRKRFCGQCKLNVYNLSGMSFEEAEDLIMRSEGRLCVRFYKRRDGSVITQDCPVGWARVRQRTRMIVTAAFSMVMALVTGVMFASLFTKKSPTVGEIKVPLIDNEPVHTMGAVALKPTPPTAEDGVFVGKLASPPPHKAKPVYRD